MGDQNTRRIGWHHAREGETEAEMKVKVRGREIGRRGRAGEEGFWGHGKEEQQEGKEEGENRALGGMGKQHKGWKGKSLASLLPTFSLGPWGQQSEGPQSAHSNGGPCPPAHPFLQQRWNRCMP